jgi:His/Glu/Gln/Arg/opine family amino acid ABC transporter permease subunit
MSAMIANLRDWLPELLVAAGDTLEMTVCAFILAAAAGLVLALMRLARARALSVAAHWYIEIVRGAPALTLLFLLYFGLPGIGVTLQAFVAAVLALGLNGAAYLAEVYRAGIEAIDKGQREAAQAIGMTRPQLMRWIVLPQSVRIILPSMGNYSVALLKDTSIASLISAPELMLRARDLTSEYYMPMEIFLLVGAMYFAMAFPLSWGVRRMELRMQRR